MVQLNSIDSPSSTATLRDFIERGTAKRSQTPDSLGGDQVEISEMARFLDRVSSLPDVRVEKVAKIRESIDRGDYETPDKLDYAINKLIADL